MCLTHSVLIQPCKEGTTVLPTGEMRRPKLRKVKGLPLSPWLVSGFDPNSASGPIPSPLHHTTLPLVGVGSEHSFAALPNNLDNFQGAKL